MEADHCAAGRKLQVVGFGSRGCRGDGATRWRVTSNRGDAGRFGIGSVTGCRSAAVSGSGGATGRRRDREASGGLASAGHDGSRERQVLGREQISSAGVEERTERRDRRRTDNEVEEDVGLRGAEQRVSSELWEMMNSEGQITSAFYFSPLSLSLFLTF